jgi:ATP-dependent Clp protease adapter protein ClpS
VDVGSQSGGRGAEEPDDPTDESAEYGLVIFNDDDHTIEYVVRLLRTVFGIPDHLGLRLALKIQKRGEAVVFTGSLEEVERKRARVTSYSPALWSWCFGGEWPLTVESRRLRDGLPVWVCEQRRDGC